MILGVDRLDMVTGIPEKILAFEKFLEDNEDQRKEVILLQKAVKRPGISEGMHFDTFLMNLHTVIQKLFLFPVSTMGRDIYVLETLRSS